MKTSDFYYDLPQELIAQTPIEKRDTSRLMTLDRVSGLAFRLFHLCCLATDTSRQMVVHKA